MSQLFYSVKGNAQALKDKKNPGKLAQDLLQVEEVEKQMGITNEFYNFIEKFWIKVAIVPQELQREQKLQFTLTDWVNVYATAIINKPKPQSSYWKFRK